MEIAVNRLDRIIGEFPNHPLAKPARKYKDVFAEMLAASRY